MELPEEMQKRINANGGKIWLLLQEIEMLGIEAGKLFAIARELIERIDSVCQEDKKKFGKWSIYWDRRCESYLNQYKMVIPELRTKADQLNDLTGGLLDWQRERDAGTDDEVLNAAILYLKNDNAP